MADVETATVQAPAPRDWDIAARWWRDMQDQTADGVSNRLADRAARARLRRVEGPLAAADPAVLRLYRLLGGEAWNDNRMATAVRLAVVLAHVRDETRGTEGGFVPSFARSLGPSIFGGEDAVLKPLRLRALLAAREEADVVRRFRRAVALLGGRVNVRDLARVLILWDRDETRTRFAFDYFGAGAATPAEALAAPAAPVL